MFLEKVIEVFEKIVVEGAMVKEYEHSKFVERYDKSLSTLGYEIEKVNDIELRNNLKNLVEEHSNNELGIRNYESVYIYDKAIRLGYSLSAVKSMFESSRK